MANTTLKTKIILNNKTEAEWGENSSFVPLKGEVCIYSDLRKIKIGDGTTTIANLQFANLTPEEINSLITSANHTHSNKAVLDATTASFTTELKNKLDGIAAGANKTTVDSALNADSTNPVQNKVIKSALDGKVPTGRKVNGKALSADITLSAADVGADAAGSANNALTQAKSYTDTEIAALVGTAPETMDTLEELAQAIEDHQDVTDALNAAIGNKANASDLTAHTGNSGIHVTSTEKSHWNDAYTHSQATHAPSNAERNVIVGVQVNGKDLTPDGSRKVNVQVPDAYVHPTGDGNLHVPATGTSNNGKVLKAGATAGSISWGTLSKGDVGLGNVDNTADANKSVKSAATLTTTRTIGATGAVTATAASFNGSANVNINVTALNAAKLQLNAGDTLILDGSF